MTSFLDGEGSIDISVYNYVEGTHTVTCMAHAHTCTCII